MFTVYLHPGAQRVRSAFVARNYSASIALTEPDEYGGGELEFFDTWGGARLGRAYPKRSKGISQTKKFK